MSEVLSTSNVDYSILNDCIKDAAIICKHQTAAFCTDSQNTLQSEFLKYDEKGLARASAWRKASCNLCIKQIEDKAEQYWALLDQYVIWHLAYPKVSEDLCLVFTRLFGTFGNFVMHQYKALWQSYGTKETKGADSFFEIRILNAFDRTSMTSLSKIKVLCTKKMKEETKRSGSSNTVGTINSHIAIIGDQNTLNIQATFETLIQSIQSSKATPEQKAEAKSLLTKFLEHPLTKNLITPVVTEYLKTKMKEIGASAE